VNTLSYKTRSFRKEDVKRDWYVIDMEGQTLGRACTQIASILRGKHKPIFTQHVDTGDYVVVLNAEKVALSGKKLTDYQHLRHTGYPGGQRASTPREILEKHPERLVEMAVRRMLPKNILGKAMYRKLFVYAGAEHPHTQKMKPLEIK